jgi:predicted RNase H-like HicB family nuclease
MTGNYIAIVECPISVGEAWWISFPGVPGVTSAADGPDQVLPQARDALATAIEAMRTEGRTPPATIEGGEFPAYDLADYEHPLVVLVPSPEMAKVA